MLDILNKALIGIFMMVQAVGSAVGITQPLPTPSPTPIVIESPVPSATPKPLQGQVKGITQTNQNPTPKHDGSRTGPIVDYFELCTGKTIKVYENERVPYKRITGETVYSTKGDIKCYENQINQLKQQANQPTTQSTNTYTTPYYTPTPYTPPQYYTCTICYSSLGTCSTYTSLYKTKEECDTAQQKMNQYGGNPPATPQPTSQPPQEYTLEMQHQDSCQKVVGAWQSYKEQFWVGPGKNYSSSYEAVLALESQRKSYQQQMYSAGCSQTLYL